MLSLSTVAESIYIEQGAPKAIKYEQLLPQIEALLKDDRHFIGALANTSAALHATFQHLWTGFYLVEGDQLVLGPFQGPVACMRIAYGKGVCGTAWKEGNAIVVPDVDRFPGHIACSSESKSEIVVPLRDAEGAIKGVLDVDSAHLNAFDETDRRYLEQLCEYLGKSLF